MYRGICRRRSDSSILPAEGLARLVVPGRCRRGAWSRSIRSIFSDTVEAVEVEARLQLGRAAGRPERHRSVAERARRARARSAGTALRDRARAVLLELQQLDVGELEADLAFDRLAQTGAQVVDEFVQPARVDGLDPEPLGRGRGGGGTPAASGGRRCREGARRSPDRSSGRAPARRATSTSSRRTSARSQKSGFACATRAALPDLQPWPLRWRERLPDLALPALRRRQRPRLELARPASAANGPRRSCSVGARCSSQERRQWPPLP